MKILVTGCVGFIGSHLCEELISLGYNVDGIDNFSDYYAIELKKINEEKLLNIGVNVIHFDLRFDNFDLLNKDYEYIFHLAAQPGISENVSFDNYMSNNLIATENLLNFAMKNTNLVQFVYISTSSVYGIYATSDEESVTKPASYYGVTKLASEQLLLSYVRNKKINGCSLRLYSVYGPRERPDKMFSKLIDCALNNKNFNLYDGSENHLRSFTYIKDIIYGITSVIHKVNETNGEVFNIGSEDEYTTAYCINLVEELTNKKINIIKVNKRFGDQYRTCAIIDKAKAILKYQPIYSIRQGVIEQINCFINQ
jgi:UDP-glucuronate 4-epimerase